MSFQPSLAAPRLMAAITNAGGNFGPSPWLLVAVASIMVAMTPFLHRQHTTLEAA